MIHDITVIIPCFNSGATIERAISSINDQIELVKIVHIIDDGSDIDTIKVLNSLKVAEWNFELLISFLPKNKGVSFARNVGIVQSRTDWVAFLDADDSWREDKIKIQMQCIYETNALFSGHAVTLEEGSGRRVRSMPEIKKYSFKDFLISNRVNTPSVIVSRSILQEFDVTLKRSEDYDLWLRILKVCECCLFVKDDLAYVHKPLYGVAGLSGSLLLMEKGELGVYRRLKSRGDLSSLGYYLCSAFSVLKFLRRIILSRFFK